MDLTNAHDRKKRSDKIKKILNAPGCGCLGFIICPVLLLVGCIVNTSSNCIDRIRSIRKMNKRKRNKRKTHPKMYTILDKIEVDTSF